jgi:D-alanine-D-alanine ligase
MRVLVLFGGRSGEHEVSVQSARSVVDALETLGHPMVTVGITLDGRWVRWHPYSSDRVLDSGDPFTLVPDPHAAKEVDVVFPVFHGPYGEDGSLQGLFELADLPYVGSGVEGSAIGLNKWVHRTLFKQAQIPVVETLAFSRGAWEADPDRWTTQVASDIGFPCFIKPVHLGSSVGISRVDVADRVEWAMDRAFQHDDLVLVEAFGGPRELEVGVLDGAPPLVSVAGEVVPSGEFYDYESKYRSDATDVRIPAEIPADVARRVRDYAIKAFGCARCEGFARVDFFWDPATDRLIVNEINTIPGMTDASMFPKLWEASGRPFPEVVRHLLDHAIARHERKAKLEAARAAAHDDEVGPSV